MSDLERKIAEAVLAEREACAKIADGERKEADRMRAFGVYEDSYLWNGYERASEEIERSVRARTTPATLSNDALAAIAESRGLRLVSNDVPVLRWFPSTAVSGVIANLGDWSLCACNGHWKVTHKAHWVAWARLPYDGDEAQAKRDAASALRSLGVQFRVED